MTQPSVDQEYAVVLLQAKHLVKLGLRSFIYEDRAQNHRSFPRKAGIEPMTARCRQRICPVRSCTYSRINGDTDSSDVHVITTDQPTAAVASTTAPNANWLGLEWLDNRTLSIQQAWKRYLPDGTLREDGRLSIWNLAHPAPYILHEFNSTCSYATCDSRTKWLAAYSEGRDGEQGTVALWKVNSDEFAAGRVDQSFAFQRSFDVPHHTWRVGLLQPKDQLVAVTTGADGIVRVWDPNSGQLMRELVGHVDSIFDSRALNHRCFVTSSKDRTVRIWDIEEGLELCIHRHLGPSIYAAPMACRGNRIAVASDGKVSVSDLDDLDQYLEGFRR